MVHLEWTQLHWKTVCDQTFHLTGKYLCYLKYEKCFIAVFSFQCFYFPSFIHDVKKLYVLTVCIFTYLVVFIVSSTTPKTPMVCAPNLSNQNWRRGLWPLRMSFPGVSLSFSAITTPSFSLSVHVYVRRVSTAHFCL